MPGEFAQCEVQQALGIRVRMDAQALFGRRRLAVWQWDAVMGSTSSEARAADAIEGEDQARDDGADRCGRYKLDVVRQFGPVARQLWLHVLLAQSLVDRREDFDEGASVVLTCRDDRAALEATVRVACEVLDDTSVAAAISPQWSTFEAVLAASEGVSELDEWRSLFRRRYLDFSPVSHKLKADDPRRPPVNGSGPSGRGRAPSASGTGPSGG